MADTYYCHACRIAYFKPPPPEKLPLNLSSYQLEKFLKHTMIPSGGGKVSVYSDTGWDAIRHLEVTTAASGCLHIDSQGRNNLEYFAGKQVGMEEYVNGVFTCATSGISLVLADNVHKVHGFAKGFNPETHFCTSCGRPVPTWPSDY